MSGEGHHPMTLNNRHNIQHIIHHLVSIYTIGFIQLTTSYSLTSLTTLEVGAFCRISYKIIMSLVT